MRVGVHIFGESDSTVYCAPYAGGVLKLADFNSACWDNSGIYLDVEKTFQIDSIIVQINPGQAAIRIDNFCLTRISLGFVCPPGADAGSCDGSGWDGGLAVGVDFDDGGSPSCQPTRATGDRPLVDDVSDGDHAIISQDGRHGWWWAVNDGTGQQAPMPPAVKAGPGWICTSGSGFTDWGAGLGINLNSDGSRDCIYDASAYRGVRFAIKGNVTGGTLRFQIVTADIEYSGAPGGKCVPTGPTTDASASGSGDCNDHYGAEVLASGFPSTDPVTCAANASWECSSGSKDAFNVISISFSSMSQEGWGRRYPVFDAAQTLKLQWYLKVHSQGAGLGPTSFDMCIGNVTFY
jgi:hypothetical protein